MSFEGYYQVLCKNGHSMDADVYWFDDEQKCSCGSEIAWINLVDQTNDPDVGYVELEVLEEPVFCDKCDCGVLKQVRYKIPKGDNK